MQGGLGALVGSAGADFEAREEELVFLVVCSSRASTRATELLAS